MGPCPVPEGVQIKDVLTHDSFPDRQCHML